MTGGKIAAFTPRVLDSCAGLYVAVFTAPPWNEPWTIEVARQRLGNVLAYPRSLGFVLVEEAAQTPIGLILGHTSVWVSGPEFWLNELCVHPDWQGKGVGSRLQVRQEAVLRRDGVQVIALHTDACSPAEAFYARHGYTTSAGAITKTRRL